MELEFHYDKIRDVLTVAGVQYSGQFFRSFSCPNPTKLYRIEKDGDVVTISEVAIETQA